MNQRVLAHREIQQKSAGGAIYGHAQKIETLLAGGKRNPSSGVTLALLSEMARADTVARFSGIFMAVAILARGTQL